MGAATNIIEIFSSIQGEGKYVGCRQIFLRFEGCNLSCLYCDTDFRADTHPVCMVEERAGAREFIRIENPIEAERAADILLRMNRKIPHHSVSFTGGEPLLHADYIIALAEQTALPIFLETNGTLCAELEKVLPFITVISMDLKLPGAMHGAGGATHWERQRTFLQIARNRDLYVKIVVSAETTDEEFTQAIALMKEEAADTLLIVQPVTPFGGCRAASPARVLALQECALRSLRDVRVIPQTHKMIDQM